ncbi:helix-turn-helix domain-containing protein [Virgibacillus phasianinus]|uniref:helix-turn-helix domain-containing protein n=1 Tax=Virgibacillus phasianinus TaxID=2017483 RepID=UPI00155FA906|nr:helix-turn-helix domain-containing protein [Virgibacillus phasianinus]
MSVFNRIRSRLLYKYIVSYLLVFLVPFMIMSGIIYYNSVSSLRQEIEQSNINKLEQVESITDERMKELATLAARISYDPRLTPFMFSHGYYSGEAIDELKKYKANSSIIEELFVYYHSGDKVYSTKGSYSINALLHQKYQFEQWDKEELMSDLHTTTPLIKPTDNVIVNNDKKKRMIAYLFPITPSSPYPYGTVMYFIDESVMTDLIQNVLGDFKGNTYIFNDSNQVVAAAINDKGIKQEDLDSFTMDKDGVGSIEIDGKSYSLVYVKSEVSGWTFISLMDADQFFGKLDQTKTIIMGTLAILLFVGLALAIFLGRNQYKPIRSLFEMTNKKETGHMNDGNELEKIRNTITNVFEDHQTLNETMYKQKPFARDQLLVRLLKGDISGNDEIDSLLSSLNIKMKDGNYFVAIIYFDKGTFNAESLHAREEIFNSMANISLPDAEGYGIDLLYNDAMAIIVSLEGLEATGKRQTIVPKIQHYIKETSSIDPYVGVGGLYDEKSKINRSYIEALAAMEYKFVNPQGSIIYFEDISSQPEQSLGYPKEQQIKLVQSLKQGDEIVALETLRNMFTMLDDKDMSIQVLKCICFDIINTIVKVMSELSLTKHLEGFNQMVDFTSIDQLHKQLQTVVLTICREVESKKESHNDELRDDILTYIKDNLYDVSLEKLAVEFQLSVSYLSRFIKEQTGVTFSHYIQDMRINDVKKQLKETNQSIKKIVTDVGYSDVANFTRKFKKIVGVTPGQYRKLNK